MFSKKNNRNMNPNPFGTYYEQMPQGQYGAPYPNQPGPGAQFQNPNQSSMYPGFQAERLQYEIRENRRRINNLAKRIVRIENYLRIRDNSDYSIIDEEQPIGF